MHAKAVKVDADGRMRFQLTHDGVEFSGVKAYQEMAKFERRDFANRYPVGTEVQVRVLKFLRGEFLIRVLPDN